MNKSFVLSLCLFFSLNNYASANEGNTYQSAVQLYEDGALTNAVKMFEVSSFSKNPDIRKKSLYMMGSIYAAQKNWSLATENFSTIIREYPNDSYADDAQYWIAKIVFLKGSAWDADSVPYFKMVFNEYPNGDMAPKAYYMAIRQTDDRLERKDLFIELVSKYPNHTIIDDAARSVYYSDFRSDIAAKIVTIKSMVSNPVSQCRLDYVLARLHEDSQQKQQFYKSASKCTQKSDIHLDVYLDWVYFASSKQQISEASRVAESFKKTYVKDGVYDKNYEVYARMLHRIAVDSNYTENSDEAVLFDYTVCNPSGLEHAKKSYLTCREYQTQTGSDPLAKGYVAECFDDYLRSFGCMYYSNKLTAGDMLIQSTNYGFSSSNLLKLLELSAKKGDRSGFAEVKSKISRYNLSSWEQRTYDELVQGM